MWFAETLARLQRSIPPIFNTVYGADPEASGHEVRDFHRPIKGRLPDGSPYSALNPDTYYWAHACFVEHLITATDTFIRRLSRAEKEQLFAESITWFERYGVSSRGTPQTYAEFETYFEHALEERLVAHRTASYGVGYATKGWPRPEAGAATGVVAGEATGQRGQLLDHHRRDAAARSRDPRPAVGRRARAPLPAVRAVCRALDGLYRRLPGRYRMHPIPLRAFGARDGASDAPSRLAGMADRSPLGTARHRLADQRGGPRDPADRAPVRRRPDPAEHRRVVRERQHAGARDRPRARRDRRPRDAPRGLRLRRHEHDGLRAGLPRGRGRRLRHPVADVGAGQPGDVRDPRPRVGGAEGAVAAGDGRRARRSAASA